LRLSIPQAITLASLAIVAALVCGGTIWLVVPALLPPTPSEPIVNPVSLPPVWTPTARDMIASQPAPAIPQEDPTPTANSPIYPGPARAYAPTSSDGMPPEITSVSYDEGELEDGSQVYTTTFGPSSQTEDELWEATYLIVLSPTHDVALSNFDKFRQRYVVNFPDRSQSWTPETILGFDLAAIYYTYHAPSNSGSLGRVFLAGNLVASVEANINGSTGSNVRPMLEEQLDFYLPFLLERIR